MELSKGYKLKMKIEEFCKENNIGEEEAKQLFYKEYLLKDEDDIEIDPDKSFSDFIHEKDKKTVEVDTEEMIKDREEEAKESKKEWEGRAYKK